MSNSAMYEYIDLAIAALCRREQGFINVLEQCEAREIIHLKTVGYESGDIESLYYLIYSNRGHDKSGGYSVRLWVRVTDKGARGISSRVVKHEITALRNQKEGKAS